jgi:polyhydroxybutyrate depolymerase
MLTALLALLPLADTPAQPVGPGWFTRTLKQGELTRSYIVHVPPGYDPKKPTPLVLAYHGAGMPATLMAWYSGLSGKADKAGFVVVYPNGTRIGSLVPTWNAGGWNGLVANGKPDDVEFTLRMLDDLSKVLNIDARRVYATGLSNGGMMCHRLGAELSDRIAAIAPVAGTLALARFEPKRPVPVILFHGTRDPIVPWKGPQLSEALVLAFKSIDETVAAWVGADGCPATPEVTELPDKVDDGTRVLRKVYGPGKAGSEVVLYEIVGGGHTWPNRKGLDPLLGKSTRDIDANDLIWEFFQKHPMPQR